jgi:AbrB family looped-hinge helix DNA binding protein
MASEKPKLVRSLRNGQLTIPIEFRRQLGIEDGTILQVSVTDGQELRIKPVGSPNDSTGSLWLRDLYAYFAPVRAEAEARGLTEAEIDAAIDAAVRAVRERRG